MALSMHLAPPPVSGRELSPGQAVPPQTIPPEQWTLVQETAALGSIKAWENVLARKSFRLLHPTDPAQVLYCYSDKLPTKDGAEWLNRYGHSQQAWPALSAAWEPLDGYLDRCHERIDTTPTLKRLFRAATLPAAPPVTDTDVKTGAAGNPGGREKEGLH